MERFEEDEPALERPFRHVFQAYNCMPSSPSFLYSDPFRHDETFRPLFRRHAPYLLVLGCSPLLVGVDSESSEVF